MVGFEWNEDKNFLNQEKHGISFEEAKYAFFDENRIIAHDDLHSVEEERMFCIGKVNDEVVTVRFSYRNKNIRT